MSKDLIKEIITLIRLYMAAYKQEGLTGTPEFVRSIRLLKKLKELIKE